LESWKEVVATYFRDYRGTFLDILKKDETVFIFEDRVDRTRKEPGTGTSESKLSLQKLGSTSRDTRISLLAPNY
jgi:hypothetical protein